MLEVVETDYRNGALVPEKSFDFPERTRIKIVIETDEQKNKTNQHSQEPTITDPEERKKALAEFLERTSDRVIANDAPRKFSREELHERR